MPELYESSPFECACGLWACQAFGSKVLRHASLITIFMKVMRVDLSQATCQSAIALALLLPR
jgi:hypothetical protein